MDNTSKDFDSLEEDGPVSDTIVLEGTNRVCLAGSIDVDVDA